MNLLEQISADFPDLSFKAAKSFYWSPRDKVVHYDNNSLKNPKALWSLLHELAHGLLDHHDFQSDFDLVSKEAEAWQKAEDIAYAYDIVISPDHIQDCLDTYRDWLYQRSTCPTCLNTSLQFDKHTYQCFNCQTVWRVSSSRLCRPYRRLASSVKLPRK
jgi:hypothetical protein